MTATCPPEDELVRMVEGALGDASLAAIERHVDTCEQCAAVIAGLGAMDSSASKPRMVGRYQLDRRIGGGGMGEVWAAWDPQLRRDIAVKLVKPERADDNRERDRLLREARALARLTHPNVLAVYDVGEVDGEVFIATELVSGDTLASRGGANADWRQLSRLYSQAARGLHAAHSVGLVHRDVKPANLLLGNDDKRVRVADFGLAVKSATPSPIAPTEMASRSAPEPQITQTGYIAGTPAYMAPEQRLGEPADARADQYALCVALAEGIAGRRPPLDIDRDALIAFVCERREREVDLDRLCGVLARGLSIDRDDRFPDVGALADAMDACVAPTSNTDNLATATGVAIVPGEARGDGRRDRMPRRRAGTPLIVGGAALAAAAAVFAFWQLRGSKTEARDAVAVTTVTADAGPDARAQLADVPIDAVVQVAVAPITGPGSAATVPNHPPKQPLSPADAQAQIEEALASARRAITKRDGRACSAALANLPNAAAVTMRNVEFHRGQCEMLSGDCEAGTKRVDAAMEAMGTPPAGEAFATTLCPIVGPFDVRFRRLVAQAHVQNTPATCRRYIKPAKQLSSEATNPRDKPGIGGVLRHLASCVGEGGDCVEAQALWTLAHDLDQVRASWEIKKCPAPPGDASPGTPAAIAANPIAMLAEQLVKVQQSITRRDLKACKTFIAGLPADLPKGLEQSVDLIHGYCEMVIGNCKAGQDLVAKAYSAQQVPAATLAMTADIYCPIAGTLDQRLARMTAQLNTFADRRSPQQRVEWCSYMLGAAKTAAGEAQSDAQKKTAADNLQRIATCIAPAKRCSEANDLWALSIATDPNASPTPRLPGCP